mgnify:CR=1 FL=1
MLIIQLDRIDERIAMKNKALKERVAEARALATNALIERSGAVTLENLSMIPGNEYYNIFSLDLCPAGPGTGPYLGLCATTLPNVQFIVLQASLPVGSPPFHFVATAPSMSWGPYSIGPATLDALSGSEPWPTWSERLQTVCAQWIGPVRDRETVREVLTDLGGLGSVASRAPWEEVEQVLEAAGSGPVGVQQVPLIAERIVGKFHVVNTVRRGLEPHPRARGVAHRIDG